MSKERKPGRKPKTAATPAAAKPVVNPLRGWQVHDPVPPGSEREAEAATDDEAVLREAMAQLAGDPSDLADEAMDYAGLIADDFLAAHGCLPSQEEFLDLLGREDAAMAQELRAWIAGLSREEYDEIISELGLDDDDLDNGFDLDDGEDDFDDEDDTPPDNTPQRGFKLV